MKAKAIKQSLVNSTGYSSIPDCTEVNYKNANYQDVLINCLNYASKVFEVSDLKKYCEKYFDRKFPAYIPDHAFMNLGRLCWLELSGANLNTKFNDMLEDIFNKYEHLKEVKEKVQSKNIVDIKTDTILEEINIYQDKVLMGSEPESLYEYMYSFEGRINWQKIKNYCNVNIKELEDKEYFSKLTNKEIKNLKSFFSIILEDISKIEVQNTVTRKPRKKRKSKTKNISKIVEKVNYLQEDPELKVSSILPEKIVGAKELWTFNIKTRELSRYLAYDENGMLIKGTTVQSFDQKKSFSKKIRKPNELIPYIQKMGKVALKKEFENIKAKEKPLTGRINKDTIILRTS